MMYRTLALSALVLFQDAGFGASLAKAEKIGLAIPDLAEAVAALDAEAERVRPEQSLLDRLETLRAQSAVLGHLHESLAKSLGTAAEIPWPAGKTTKAKLAKLGRRALVLGLPGGGDIEVAYDALDPDGVAKGYAAGGGAPAFAAIWLARAGRWEAALKAIGDRGSTHPLIVEARRRGVLAILSRAQPLLEKDKWEDVLAILAEARAIASSEPAIAELRGKLRARLLAAGREAATLGRRAEALRAAALIEKEFPDDKSAAQEIRTDAQWTLLDDPKAFKRPGKKGDALLLDATSKEAASADLDSLPHDCTGFSARVRFDKDSKAHGGLMWEVRGRILWIDMENSYAVLSHQGSDKRFANDFYIDAPRAEIYDLTLLLEDGHYIAKVDGKEVGRVKTLATKLEGLALNAAYGKAWFDRIRIRRK